MISVDANKPIQVSIAINLIYFLLVLDLFICLFSESFSGFWIRLILTICIVYRIYKGYNWGRILLFIWYMAAWLFLCYILFILKVELNNKISIVLQIVLQCIVLILLFQKESSDWFKVRKDYK